MATKRQFVHSLLIRSRPQRWRFATRCSSGITAYNTLTSTYSHLPHQTTTTKAAAWYVCGPTVYDSAHLGHGRTYVLLDIIRRVALYHHRGFGPRPLYVMNVTDVDDKIIRRSKELVDQISTQSTNDNTSTDATKANEADDKEADPIALARHYETQFFQDMDRLNILRPDVICRVSEHVQCTIVPYIKQIVDGGMAYVIPETHADSNEIHGSVYFDVRAFEAKSNGRTKYGKLAPDVASTDFFSWSEEGETPNNNEEHTIQTHKRDPRDFCLWKHRPRQSTSLDIEPSSVSYPSPWGPGRPGWHVECSAMIERLSCDFASTHQFLVHAGGVDLKFPHHSNEIAQAEAFELAVNQNDNGEWKEWIPHWMHTGHLYVRGRKMSKSLKNFVTIREMLDVSNDANSTELPRQDNEWSSPADDFRLWCLGLSGSYRGPATYSKDRMEEARVIREKWVRFLIEGQRFLDDFKDSQSTRKWRSIDIELFQTVTASSINCHNALIGHASLDGGKGSYDLDGATFVKEMTNVTEEGMKYVEQTKVDPNSCPTEPLKFTLSSLRDLIALVGFTTKTYNAGTHSQQLENASTSSKDNNLINEMVIFRSKIRSLAIHGIRQKDEVSSSNDILSACDQLRDEIMTSLGVEILDGKTDSIGGGGWRSCSPRPLDKKK